MRGVSQFSVVGLNARCALFLGIVYCLSFCGIFIGHVGWSILFCFGSFSVITCFVVTLLVLDQ